MSQASDTEGLSVGIPSANLVTIHMPADELVAGLSLNLGQLELLVGVGVQVIEVDNFLTVVVGEDTLLVVGGDGNGNGLLHFRLGLNFLELSLDGGIALIGAILIEAQAGNTEGLSIGTPSDFRSALALPANELVAFLGGNGGNVVLLVANFLLVALEDNRACTDSGEGALLGVNGEVHSEVMLLGLGLLNLLELSSQGNIASGSIAIVESRVGVHELGSTDIQSAFAIAFPSPTSELITFVSGDHVLQTFDLALSGQMLVGQGLSFLVVGEVTGFGIAQVDVNGNFLLDLGLLLGLLLLGIEADELIAISDSSNILVTKFSIGNKFHITMVPAEAIFQVRNFSLSAILSYCYRIGHRVSLKISPGNSNGLCFALFCKRCKRHAHDEHESGSQQSQQTSFEVRFLHVNFSYSLKFI